MAKADASKLDWNNLGFEYMDLPYRYTAHWKDGAWQDGGLTENSTLPLNEAAVVLHYGQGAFEGMKAYRTPDNKIQLFRPDRNAARLKNSAERLLMPVFPEDKFVDAVKQVVKANADFVPPYGTGGTLYIRPLLIGSGATIGVHAAPEYTFTVFAMPVGSYFKGGMTPVNFTTSQYDRAAHKVLVNLKLVVITLHLYCPAKMLIKMDLPTVFTLTQSIIRRSKKLDLLTSLVSLRIMSLQHLNHHLSFHQSPSIHYYG